MPVKVEHGENYTIYSGGTPIEDMPPCRECGRKGAHFCTGPRRRGGFVDLIANNLFKRKDK